MGVVVSGSRAVLDIVVRVQHLLRLIHCHGHEPSRTQPHALLLVIHLGLPAPESLGVEHRHGSRGGFGNLNRRQRGFLVLAVLLRGVVAAAALGIPRRAAGSRRCRPPFEKRPQCSGARRRRLESELDHSRHVYTTFLTSSVFFNLSPHHNYTKPCVYVSEPEFKRINERIE